MKAWWDLTEEEKKQRSKWVWILIGIFVLFIWVNSNSSNQSQSPEGVTQTNSVQSSHTTTLKVEISEIAPTFIRIINRNDYDWHNVKITVNNYYSCWDFATLKSGESISVNAPQCADFAINHNAINSVQIITDEGEQLFNR